MENISYEQRMADIKRFYEIMDQMEDKVGGKRLLSSCSGKSGWPQRGVYFFFEPGENRRQSGIGPRVVRVGTHGLAAGSSSTLWGRLKQHQGNLDSGGGNHRGSVFRMHVGSALIKRDGLTGEAASTWEGDRDGNREVREKEAQLEEAVSQYIRQMPFLWLEIDDEPGPASLRGFIESNSIALLSNFLASTNPIDPPSSAWLGRCANRETIRMSGLWNVNHITEHYHQDFLGILSKLTQEV